MRNDDDQLLTAEELAELTQSPITTVYAWNHRGTGPRRIKVGRQVLYRKSDVDAWLESRVVEPTARTA